MSGAVVEASQLTRRFGSRLAVSRVSLTLHAGEAVALLGPNGAGKTTTLRMLAGLIEPSGGSVVLNGTRLTRDSADALRQHIGLLTEAPGHWDRLSVRLNLLTYARLYGLSHPLGAVRRALATVGLADRLRDAAGTLSKGLRQRLAIARALLHDPPIVLLDEPTAGLDPASARQIRDLILDLRQQGRALLVSTHNLAEAEQLADRLAVLKTALLALDTPAALRRSMTGTRLVIGVEGPAERWLKALRTIVPASVAAEGSTLAVGLPEEQRVPDVVSTLVAAGARIRRVDPSARTLEEVYLSLVGPEEQAPS
jgi:ABC-2 type transport system ATP-binding protein